MASTQYPESDAATGRPSSSIPGHSSRDRSRSFLNHLGIPITDEFAKPTAPISNPEIALPEVEAPSSRTNFWDDNPSSTTDPVQGQTLQTGATIPRLDSSENYINTEHIEDISTLGCRSCQQKSAERLEAGEIVSWETIHQQHLREPEAWEEGGLELSLGRSNAQVEAAAETVTEIPDTTDIGFHPEPYSVGTGARDPIEQLKTQGLVHSSSFPAVPEPQTAGATGDPNNPFGDEEGDDFFSNPQKQAETPIEASDNRLVDEEDDFFNQPATEVVKPVEPADSNFFGDEEGGQDDFFSRAVPNGIPEPALGRSDTADLVMGGGIVTEVEDGTFAEGLPLVESEEPEDDFFAHSKTPLDPNNVDEDADFFDNPKRKSTALAAGFPGIESPTLERPPIESKTQPEPTASNSQAALDDDDFLDDEPGQPAPAQEKKSDKRDWFDDGDDFLSDEDEAKSAPPAADAAAAPAVSSKYTPAAITTQPYTPAYQPTGVSPAVQPSQFTPAASPYAPAFQQQQRPSAVEASRAESFVDKTSGYHSPYDLPDDIVKPVKKRPPPVQQPAPYGSYGQQQFGTPNSVGTPMSAQSAYTPGGLPSSGLGPPAEIRGRTGFGGQVASPSAPPAPPGRAGASPAPNAVPPKTLKQQSSGFFEELPMTIPKRSTSSNTGRYTPGARVPSGGVPPQGPPPTSAPISMNRTPSYSGPPSRPTSVEPGYAAPLAGALGVPSQYSVSPALGTSPLARSSSPYTPAPSAATSNYAPKPTTSSLYASPPGAVRGSSPYAQRPNAPPTAQRSSSVSSENRYGPSSHQEPVGLGVTASPERVQTGATPPSHTPTGRPPSRDRPGTMESMKHHALGGVAEENEDGSTTAPSAFEKALPPPPSAAANRYGPSSRKTPPPPTVPSALSRLSSPPPRSGSPGRYTPAGYQSHTASSSLSSSILSPTDTSQFAPPKRSQTQSPGFAALRSANVHGIQRPSSAAATAANAYTPYSPVDARRQSYPVAQVQAPAPPPQLFMAPPPGSLAASDTLERWKGAPLFCWGFGGNVVTMFPVHTSRWNAETGQQMVKTSLGEVKSRPSKDILNEDEFFEDLGKFPGPVFGGRAGGKARKKEISTWMEAKILKLEGEYTRSRDPRSMEKVILWKVVKLCVDNDGVLAGKPEIDAAVRQIISPESETVQVPAPKNALQQTSVVAGNALETIRTHLIKGDREAAVWYAIENRQWAHAVLISSTTSPELYKRAVQEFVRQEVKTVEGSPRPNMESLAVLYEVFAGNWEEAIDDLVPASTRMGMTMISTTGGSVGSSNALEALEKWRDTLGLMLSNRSNNDIQAIAKLGSLLESYNRIEAAHVCYLFSVPAAVFGGAEDSNKTIFSLLGANHVNNPFNYGRDLDAIVLSEIYEYALSLLPNAPPLTTVPHLLPFKLHHANLLAQYGFKTEAQKYSDAITASFKITGRPQPYVHALLVEGIDELNKRLSQAPRDNAGGSWMSKPTLDNISGSLLSRFNKFVSGDDESEAANGAAAANGGIPGAPGVEIEGPFAKLAATPEMPRIPSGVDLYGAGLGGGFTPYNPAQPPLGTSPAGMKPASFGGRYAPKAAGTSSAYTPQTPKPTEGPTSSPAYGGYGGYEPQHTTPYGSYGGYEPTPPSYQPVASETQPPQAPENGNGYGFGGYQSSPAPVAPHMSTPSLDSGYSTLGQPTTSTTSVDEPLQSTGGYQPAAAGGYEAPSSGGYGYDPQAEFKPYEPSPEHSDDEGGKKKPKSKKKGFMDDDDDGYTGGGGGVTSGGSGAADDDAAKKKKKDDEEEENRKMVAAIAEREKKEAEEAKKAKGGWFGGWFGGKKDPNAPAVHKAKLGEENSFVYDPDLKKWVNKKGGATDSAGITPSGTPPPPKRMGSPAVGGPPSGPPSKPGTPRPGTSSSVDSFGGPPRPPGSAPPTSHPASMPPPTSAPSAGLMPPPGTPGSSSREPSPARPPARPATTGKVDEMEELLGGGGSVRKGAAKAKGRKRYVEVL